MFRKENKYEKGKKRSYPEEKALEKNAKKIRISESSDFKDMKSTNFRDKTLFNQEIRTTISHIVSSIDGNYAQGLKFEHHELKVFQDRLKKLLDQLIRYYTEERKKTYRTEEEAIERAKEVLSEYLQDVIYILLHPREFSKLSKVDELYFQKMMLMEILNHPLFLFSGSKGRVVIWSDPENSSATLGTLVRGTDLKKELDLFFTHLEEKCSPEKILEILNHRNSNGISAFHGAAMDNKVDILLDLLFRAEKLYGKNKEELIKFLNNENFYKYTALNSSVDAKSFDTAKALIDQAKRIYGEDKEGFIKFLTKTNKNQFSPLTCATFKGGDFKLLQLLLNTAKEAFGENKKRYIEEFLNHKNSFNSNALNCLMENGDFSSVELLIEEAREAYKQAYGENYQEEFRNSFLDVKNKAGYTPINNAAMGWKISIDERKRKNFEKIIEKLRDNGANPDIENPKGFSARQNAPKFFSKEKSLDMQEKSKRPRSPTAKSSSNKKSLSIFPGSGKEEKKEKGSNEYKKNKDYKR